MRELAEAFAAAGFHVEMPRLPGHGTHVDDMMPTRWADWVGEAEAAYQRLAARSDKVVVAGLSMGGALTLRMGADHPEIAGLICINPATAPIGRRTWCRSWNELLERRHRGGARGSAATSPTPTSPRAPTRAPRSGRCCR